MVVHKRIKYVLAALTVTSVALSVGLYALLGNVKKQINVTVLIERRAERRTLIRHVSLPESKISKSSLVKSSPMTRLNVTFDEKPSCEALIEGDGEQIRRAFSFAKHHHYTRNTHCVNMAKNCETFLKECPYILNASAEETGFPLAFSIVMYKDVEQVERLLRTIYRPTNFYCIHVDKNASELVKNDIKHIVNCLPNVFTPTKVFGVVWGEFSVLGADLSCMEDLLGHPGWRYFINLTGQEYPLKTNLEIVRILKIMNGANIVDANSQLRWRWRRWDMAGPPPHNISLYKGNVHVAVNRDFVDYAINNPIAKDFTRWLTHTKVPDETFFATLNHNPQLHIPGSSTGPVDTDYDKKPYIARFKNWGPQWGEKSFDWPCGGVRNHNVCVFGMSDLPLLTSRRELFANKFYVNYQPQTFDCMEEWLRNRTVLEYKGMFEFNYTFYRTMPHLNFVYRPDT
ncbi:beta-1,3-galactosyl-O-glycosyl-glycoprotein beta-1,6-N-acetylglucosaminyltransferase-like [Haliotis cracherodii]|uniref:beta-1,3-galactosyl-O-glycosyl-glycoprotein beta-1,6-N-acetylglucosaminyltransferase-like n=1 Tax=Haliotis cracherodii TaxID=6455 RepID=UPI0039EA8561